jgi:hypothetical protein
VLKGHKHGVKWDGKLKSGTFPKTVWVKLFLLNKEGTYEEL